MIEREIERDLQARKEALNFKRGLLADKQANTAAELRSAEAQRIALYEHAIRQVETEAGQFDPRGRQALERGKIAMGLRQRQAQAAADFEKRTFERAKAGVELRNQLADAMLKERKLAGIGMGGAGGPPGQDKQVFTSEQLAAQLPPGTWVPPRGWKGTLREYGQLADAAGKGQQVAGGGAVGAEQRKTQRERVLPDVFNIDASGNRIPFEPIGTDTEVADLRKRVAGTRKVVKMLDEAFKLRSGWSTKAGNSDENQRLRSLMGAAKLAVKDADNLGQLTEGDMELIVGRLGTDDFTQFRDFDAGVAQARKLLVDGLRTSLISQGLNPNAAANFDIPNNYGRKHVPSAGEATAKKHYASGTDERYDQNLVPGERPTKRNPISGLVEFE
jgi:hypothetical protein